MSVFRDFTLETFRVSYLIDLIPIPLVDVCVIVEMDWLRRFGAMIECERQLMTVRTLSGGEPIIYGEGISVGSTFCSAARARQYLQHGCLGYLVYVVDTRDEGRVSVSDVPIHRAFTIIFPEYLPSLPLVRHMEFRIDLIPGEGLIAKASYYLTPPEM